MAAFTGLALFVAPLRRRSLAAFWVPLASYGLLSIVPGFVEPRVVLPLLPMLAVAGGVLAADALRVRLPLRAVVAGGLAAAFGHELGVALNADLHLLRDPRYAAERWLAGNVDGVAIARRRPDFMPRLERLGFAPVWFQPAEIRPKSIEVRSYEYAVLTWPYHPDSDEAWQEALRNGRTGAPVVFDARPHTPLDRWFRTRLHPGSAARASRCG
jgi:hypothetical protein